MSEPSTSRHPGVRCRCGKQLDAATGDPGTELAPGDLTLCGYCGELMQFGGDLAPAPVAIETLTGVEPMLRAKIKRMQTLIRERRPS